MKASRTGLAVFVLLSIPGRFLAQAPPLDPEFQVNTYTTGLQYSGRVAVNRDGSFVVVWQSFGPDGDGFSISGQRFDSLGAPLGSEFPINSHTTGWQQLPSIAMDDEGSFVVVWNKSLQEIQGQRFDSSGAKIGSEFPVNTDTAGLQSRPRVASNGGGSFVVVWGGTGLDGSGYGVFGQRFNASGAKVGAQFQVNTYTTGTQDYPQVAVDRAGNFVVVWNSSGQDGDGFAIVGQRFNGSGAKAGPEFLVNTYTSGSQQRPQEADDRAGNFVVVWESSGQDGDGKGVFGQRFNASGERVGSEFPVNTYTTHDQSLASVAVAEKGDFVVAWTSLGQGTVFLATDVFGQRFDRSGAAVGAEFPVNTYTTDGQDSPEVSADPAGNFVIVWGSAGHPDGSSSGVFARRSNLSPARMGVDLHAAGGSVSDLNGVLEPGETVSVEPSWKLNMTTAILQPIALSGTASNISGPVSGTIEDGTADYGLTLPGATTNCYDGTLDHDCYVFHAGVPTSRPAPHLDLTFDEASSTGGTKAWKLHLGDSFTDVPRSQAFYKKIEALLHNGITTGCDATQYCPALTVSRGQMGIFIAKGIAGAGELVPTAGILNGQPYNCSPGGTSRFSDVSPTDAFCRHVHYLGAQNVTLGCGATTYCPGEPVTRDAMASFIAKALVAPLGGSAVLNVYTDPGTGRSYSCNPGTPNLHFADVPVSNAFCRHIHFLWAKGIVDGCTTTLYCPGSLVQRDAMAKFLANGFGLELYGP